MNADAMSRLPCTQSGRSSHDEDADSFPGLDSGRGSHEDADSLPGSVSVSACTRHKTDPLPEMSQEDWRKVQLEVGIVLRAMEKGEKPRYNLLKTKSLEARLLVQRWRKLEVIDGVLWRRFEDDRGRGSYTQLVVPRALRDGVLGELHAGVVGGHLGEDCSLQCSYTIIIMVHVEVFQVCKFSYAVSEYAHAVTGKCACNPAL